MTLSSIQGGRPGKFNRACMASYVIPPLAAGLAIAPSFWLFRKKSAQQVGNPIPKIGLAGSIKGGFKAAPTVGAIVGTQIIVQDMIERLLQSRSKKKKGDSASIASLLAGAIFVGGISAPLYIILNGQTLGRSARESWKARSFRQAGAIVARETSFLLSLRISGPVAEAMKGIAGDNRAVEYGSATLSGVIGSLVGHPADTALTLWQNGMRVANTRQLMRGTRLRAAAVGVFSVLYKFNKESLTA